MPTDFRDQLKVTSSSDGDYRVFKAIELGRFLLSIQASAKHFCYPRKTLPDLKQYKSWEVIVLEDDADLNPSLDPRFTDLLEKPKALPTSWVDAGQYVPTKTVQALFERCRTLYVTEDIEEVPDQDFHEHLKHLQDKNATTYSTHKPTDKLSACWDQLALKLDDKKPSVDPKLLEVLNGIDYSGLEKKVLANYKDEYLDYYTKNIVSALQVPKEYLAPDPMPLAKDLKIFDLDYAYKPVASPGFVESSAFDKPTQGVTAKEMKKLFAKLSDIAANSPPIVVLNKAPPINHLHYVKCLKPNPPCTCAGVLDPFCIIHGNEK